MKRRSSDSEKTFNLYFSNCIIKSYFDIFRDIPFVRRMDFRVGRRVGLIEILQRGTQAQKRVSKRK